MQPTKQARSRATQDRILRATEELLRSESFEAISVRQIVGEAGTSIGSFYGRFRDKEELLHALYAQYESRLEKKRTDLEAALLDVATLELAAGKIVDHFVDVFGRVPNLSRAVFEYTSRDPDSESAREHSAERLRQYAFVMDALHRFEDQMTTANAKRSIELSLYFVTVSCRNRFFYPLNPYTRTLKINKKELRAELSRMMVAYLRN